MGGVHCSLYVGEGTGARPVRSRAQERGGRGGAEQERQRDGVREQREWRARGWQPAAARRPPRAAGGAAVRLRGRAAGGRERKRWGPAGGEVRLREAGRAGAEGYASRGEGAYQER
eukprot:135553-Chlamydomonas_euryale.AAC.1